MKEETKLTTKLKISAVNHPLTVKPGTILATHLTMMILMINKNKPNVRMVMGMVNITRIGLMKLFIKPSTTATSKAVTVSSTCTPYKI